MTLSEIIYKLQDVDISEELRLTYLAVILKSIAEGCNCDMNAHVKTNLNPHKTKNPKNKGRKNNERSRFQKTDRKKLSIDR